MTIQNAEEAAELVTSQQTTASVLADIEWAARHGHRSWQFHKLAEEILQELHERGFKITPISAESGYVTVEW